MPLTNKCDSSLSLTRCDVGTQFYICEKLNSWRKKTLFLKLWAHHIMLAPNSLVYSQIRLFLKYPKSKAHWREFWVPPILRWNFFHRFLQTVQLAGQFEVSSLPCPYLHQLHKNKVFPLPSFENGPSVYERDQEFHLDNGWHGWRKGRKHLTIPGAKDLKI